MPVKRRKKGNKHRIVEPDGKISKTSKGNPKDGGGHRTKKKAERQKRAINNNR